MEKKLIFKFIIFRMLHMNMFLISGADNGINPSNTLDMEQNGMKFSSLVIYLNWNSLLIT